jgi:cell division protein FtsX
MSRRGARAVVEDDIGKYVDVCTNEVDQFCLSKEAYETNVRLYLQKKVANEKIKECRQRLIDSQSTEKLDLISTEDQAKYLRVITQFNLWLIDRAINVLKMTKVSKVNEEIGLVESMCRNMSNQLEVQYNQYLSKKKKGIFSFGK